MSGDTHPTLPLPAGPGGAAPGAAARRPERRRGRGAVPWIIALVVVAVLAVVAWFVAEQVTRDIVTRMVRDQVITQLALPADQQIDVGLDEPVLPQVIAGRLDRLDISGDDVPLGDVVADVSVRATGIPIRGDGDIDAAEATVSFGEDDLQSLLAQVSGIPEAGIALTPPDVAVEVEIPILSLAVPIGIDLTPSANDGDIVLTPSAVRVAGTELTADALRDRLGSVSDQVLRDYPICIKDRLPAGLTVREVRVDTGALVAEVDVAGAIIRDAALQQNGTCG